MNKLNQLLARYGDSAALEELDAVNTAGLGELLIWLGQQDDSLRYHLALELDIPLQHLNTTCETVAKLSAEF